MITLLARPAKTIKSSLILLLYLTLVMLSNRWTRMYLKTALIPSIKAFVLVHLQL